MTRSAACARQSGRGADPGDGNLSGIRSAGLRPEGVASAILRRLLADVRAENPELRRLALNSSPYGLPFYLRAGFQPADEERTINGIRFTAMVYDL